MKIFDNGTVREMTEKEIEEYGQTPEATDADKAEAFDILMGGAS